MQIDILIYDRCLGSEVFAFADTLTMANSLHAGGRTAAQPQFQVRLVCPEGGQPMLAGGLTRATAQVAGKCDLLVVPGMEFGDREALVAHAKTLTSEQELIRRQWSSGKRVAAICVGAFLVATAGIASGRRIATGWPVASLLPTIDPSLIVELHDLVVTDGDLISTGAFTAAYDLALNLVAVHLDADIATRLRRILLLDAQRPGQMAFARLDAIPETRLTAVHLAKTYLRDNLARPFNLGKVATASGTSSRTLQRKFKQQVGITPLSFHRQLRIDRAKQMLETTKASSSQIATEIGYGDEATFRTLFRRITGLAPGDYRRRFALLRT
jgi:transcriptional regulator GlxA family with amidase domain